jgi:hypothetical protein
MKITLATLASATEQEVFDQVVNHLMTQMKPSANLTLEGNPGSCAYRNDDGLSCAAGCLMDDVEALEVKKASYNNAAWTAIVGNKLAPETHWELITQLQKIHDQMSPDRWHHALRNFAKRENLQFNWTPNEHSNT